MSGSKTPAIRSVIHSQTVAKTVDRMLRAAIKRRTRTLPRLEPSFGLPSARSQVMPNLALLVDVPCQAVVRADFPEGVKR
jgi:hypothetical protein